MVIWIVSGLLAVVFAGSGLAKLTMSRQRLIDTGQTGIAVYPMPLVRVTAGCELLAAAGLLLPWLTGIAPGLTPLAAGGLMIVMVGAAYAHTTLREPWAVLVNVVLFALCGYVLVVRLAGS